MLGLLVVGPGCKMAAESASPSLAVYDFEDDSIDADEAAFAAIQMEQEMEQEMAQEMAPISSRREARRSRRASRSSGASGTTPPEPDMAPAKPGSGAGDSAELEPATGEDDDQDHGRYIVYTATMQVSVFNLEDAKARAESLPDKYGGFVQNLSSNHFVMRIPAAKLRTAMDELAGLGVVENRTLDAADVTEEYLDIETRIEVLQATQKQMMDLLTKARTVEEALKVRQALDEITMELEVLKGRLRRLSNLVSFSTLTLTLVERGPHTPTPSSNDPFPWVDDLGVEATEWK